MRDRAPSPVGSSPSLALVQAMWILEGEKYDNAMHTYNRYGIQLGERVLLWGGFTGDGKFTLREWAPRPKMTKADWVQHLPAVKRAAHTCKQQKQSNMHATVRQDNERFLCQPEVYKAHGLKLHRFPQNSEDLDPIEPVWAWLCATSPNVSSLITPWAGRSASISSSKGRPSCCKATARRRRARSTAVSRSWSRHVKSATTVAVASELPPRS